MATEPEMVTLEEAKEQVKIVSEMLGRLHIAHARTIVDEMGAEKGKKLILKAIRKHAQLASQKAKDELLAEGREPTLENRRSLNRFKFYGMLERFDQFEVEGEHRWGTDGCAMGKGGGDLGE